MTGNRFSADLLSVTTCVFVLILIFAVCGGEEINFELVGKEIT